MQGQININYDNNTYTLCLIGDFTQESINKANTTLKEFALKTQQTPVIFDFAQAQKFDSAGMIFIVKYFSILISQNCIVSCKNMNSTQKSLLLFYRKNQVAHKITPAVEKHNPFYKLGKLIYTHIIGFLGLMEKISG